MNILVVAGYNLYSRFDFSFVHAQASAYVNLGHRVRALVMIPVGKKDWDKKRFFPFLQQRTEDGVEVFCCRFLSISKYGEKGFNADSSVYAVNKKLNHIFGDFLPDIIHVHYLSLRAISLGRFLKEKFGCPLVATTHGSDTFIPFNTGNRTLLKQCVNQVDHLVCVSSLLRQRLENCGVSAPMSVILNGFHIKNAVPSPNKSPLSLVQAGYLVARKKADDTICAFAVLHKRHPEATLDIIGSGSELARFQSLCEKLSVAEAVRFHGFLPNEETLSQMAKAHFFVMPSINEGFGIVYLEAMASGCITIGTEGEGIADLIVSGKNGFLVPPDDPDAIVRTVEWCLDHPKDADKIANQGRKDAMSLAWEKNANEYIKLFKELQYGV